MLSAMHLAVPRSVAFKPLPWRSVAIWRFVVTLLLAVLPALLLRPAAAQGSFTTNKPFLLSVDATRHFTLTGIQVVYKPAYGSPTTGFLTISGTPDNRSLSLYSNVHLSFSPTINGTPTVTDTFPVGVVTALGTNLYHLASMGSSASGNTFNLYGGFLQSPASAASHASSSHASSSHAFSYHR